MEERVYGDITVRVTYGKENLTDLLVEYVRGLAEHRDYGKVTYVDRKEDLQDGDVCKAVKG